MSVWSVRGFGLRHLAVVLLAGGLGAAGCGQKAQPEAAQAEAGSAAKPASAPQPVKGEEAPAGAGEPGAKAPAAPVKRDRLHQAFADAVRPSDNPPADANRPPDETVSKKPVFKILDDVSRMWDSIRFVSPAGKKIRCTARVETSLGAIEIALFPEQAPNHVRNFIALARAGYYEQLFFDRIRSEQGEGQTLQSVEAGCPLGTGEPGNGSIGYWLKAEFTPGNVMSHDEGVVCACRGSDADTAACRFYIDLSKAPFLDGNDTIFGKVVQGLDMARRIHQQPVIIDDQESNGARQPEKPVIIHKVTIHEQETEASSK